MGFSIARPGRRRQRPTPHATKDFRPCRAPVRAADSERMDLSDRTDVEALLRRFYERALVDDVLWEPFAQLRSTGLAAHIPTMCDFWETVLFRAGRYRGSALSVHRDIHERTPLSADHFIRWLNLWCHTVDEMYCGPAAERAKGQAARIARAMHRRLTGVDAPELLVTTPARGGQALARTGSDGRWPRSVLFAHNAF